MHSNFKVFVYWPLKQTKSNHENTLFFSFRGITNILDLQPALHESSHLIKKQKKQALEKQYITKNSKNKKNSNKKKLGNPRKTLENPRKTLKNPRIPEKTQQHTPPPPGDRLATPPHTLFAAHAPSACRRGRRLAFGALVFFICFVVVFLLVFVGFLLVFCWFLLFFCWFLLVFI